MSTTLGFIILSICLSCRRLFVVLGVMDMAYDFLPAGSLSPSYTSKSSTESAAGVARRQRTAASMSATCNLGADKERKVALHGLGLRQRSVEQRYGERIGLGNSVPVKLGKEHGAP